MNKNDQININQYEIDQTNENHNIDNQDNVNQNIINNIRSGEYKLMGRGSCRYVFDMNNGYVVKVAKDIRGLEQNRNEYKIYSSRKSDLFADIVYISRDDRFLIMVKATKLKSFKYVYRYYNVNSIKSLAIKNNLIEDINNNLISTGDLRRISSWGLINGVPKLIDYGLTHSTFKKYYSGNIFIKKRYPHIRYW